VVLPVGIENTGILALLSIHGKRPSSITKEDKNLGVLLTSIGAENLHALQVADAHRKSERSHASLLRSLPGLVYSCINDSSWTMEDKLSLADIVTESLTGDKISFCGAVIHESDRARVLDERGQALSKRCPFLLSYRMLLTDGQQKWVRDYGMGVYSDSGELDTRVGFIVDVTKEVKLEQQLFQSQKLEAIGQLAAGVAHEINTPTQFIGDNLCFIQESFSDLMRLLLSYRVCTDTCTEDIDEAARLREEARTMAKQIDLDFLLEDFPRAVAQAREGNRRIAEIVMAMKAFAHPGTENMVWVDINQSIISTVQIARSEWKYVAKLETDLAKDLQSVRCMPGEVNQVILNLIINAAHAIGEQRGERPDTPGMIKIVTRKENDSCVIRIEDNGPGIPKKIQHRIFESFFTTKPVGKGTGQGLALAHSVIVENHKGTIEVQSEPGSGTTFVIRIPIDSLSQ
jgi:signal transduction histidine kinase